MDFTQKYVDDPHNVRKKIKLPRPTLIIDGTHIRPSEAHKYLGIIFDQELRWGQQCEAAVAKGIKWTLQFRRSRPSAGISQKLMRQLYNAVAIPKMTYTADIWFSPICKGEQKGKGSIGAAQAVGITLVAKLIRTKARRPCTVAISIDNQAVIQATHHRYPHPGQYLIEQFYKQAKELKKKLGNDFKLTVRWITGHNGIEGNKMADARAK